MASLFKRRKQYWASYYLDGVQVWKSLRTTSERIARAKLKQIEYELAVGELHVSSRLAVLVMLYLTWLLERSPNLAERLIAFPDVHRGCRISRTSCSIAC